MRTKPIQRAPWQRPANSRIAKPGSTIDADLRRLVLERDNWTCVCCGERLEPGWQCHHRKLRSRGGSDSASNLIALCAHCHRRIHGHPKWATAHGFMVSAYDDPATQPVAYRLETWRLLRHDGRLIDVETGQTA